MSFSLQFFTYVWLAGSFPEWCSYFRTSSFHDPLKWIQSFNSWSGSQFGDFSACSWKRPVHFWVLELLAGVQDRRVVCLLLEVRPCIHHVLASPGKGFKICHRRGAGKAPVFLRRISRAYVGDSAAQRRYTEKQADGGPVWNGILMIVLPAGERTDWMLSEVLV